jgi:hypothetical protein
VVAVVAIVAIVAVAAILMMPRDDDGNGDEWKINFNGIEYTWDELAANFTARAVGDKTGYSLSDIMNSTDFASVPGEDQNNTMFRITADDWTKNVSWMDLQSGIIVETDHMAYFPDLPGAFKVKNVASIDDVPLGPIMFLKVGGSMADNVELTWAELSTLNEVTIQVSGQDTQALSLAAVLEYAGFTGLENATVTIEGVDGYSKDVNWTLVQDGYLIEDGMKSYFEGQPGSFRVRNVIRVWVEY